MWVRASGLGGRGGGDLPQRAIKRVIDSGERLGSGVADRLHRQPPFFANHGDGVGALFSDFSNAIGALPLDFAHRVDARGLDRLERLSALALQVFDRRLDTPALSPLRL